MLQLALPIFLLAYCAASLLHHVHNAEFLGEYPNMPAWLTPAGVYGAWLGVTAVGVAGYSLLQLGYRLVGLAALGIYGALGLYGLGHYSVAPLSAHTSTMHLTIWLEVVAGVLLMATVAGLMLQRRRDAKERRSK